MSYHDVLKIELVKNLVDLPMSEWHWVEEEHFAPRGTDLKITYSGYPLRESEFQREIWIYLLDSEQQAAYSVYGLREANFGWSDAELAAEMRKHHPNDKLIQLFTNLILKKDSMPRQSPPPSKRTQMAFKFVMLLEWPKDKMFNFIQNVSKQKAIRDARKKVGMWKR